MELYMFRLFLLCILEISLEIPSRMHFPVWQKNLKRKNVSFTGGKCRYLRIPPKSEAECCFQKGLLLRHLHAIDLLLLGCWKEGGKIRAFQFIAEINGYQLLSSWLQLFSTQKSKLCNCGDKFPFLDLLAKQMSSADTEAVSWDQPLGKESPRRSSRVHQPSPRVFAWVGGEFSVLLGELKLVATSTKKSS